MNPKRKVSYFVSLSLILAAFALPPGWSQGQSSVSVVSLKAQTAPNGQQLVALPSGPVVPLPGPGVNGNRVDVYMGGQGGYWYVDRNGQNFDLTPYVERLAAYNQGNQQSNQNQSSDNNSGSSQNSAYAAGLGAMAGAALGTAYSNYNDGYGDVPYGYAVGVAADGRHYYTNANGNNVYINSGNTYQANLAQQQNWYAREQQNPQRAQAWQQAPQNNPFVARNDVAADGGRRRHGPGSGDGPFGGGGAPGAGGRFAKGNNGPGLGNGPSGDGPGGRFGGQNGPPGGGPPRGGGLGRRR